MTRFVRARTDRRSELGLRLTLNAALFIIGAWVFGNVLEDVLERESLVRWDIAVARFMATHQQAPLSLISTIVSAIASPGTWVVMVIVAIWLIGRHANVLAVAWVATLVGGGIVQTAIKHLVHRQRPGFLTAYLNTHTYSFPSGHTMDATICYPLLVILLVRMHPHLARSRQRLFAIAIVMIVLVGLSRIYLGAHFPSDVAGGMAAGAAWLGASLAVLTAVEARRP